MKISQSTEILKPLENADASVITNLYPEAFCLVYKYEDETRHFQILRDANLQKSVPLGYSTKSEEAAWSNAFSMISKKMMKTLTL